MNIKKIKSWQVILGTLVLLSVPTLFVFSLERYTTSNEDFCMTCHYKMWGEDFLVHSNIHPDSVRCPQCHANHKQIIPKDFSADSDRVNSNCVRCHGEIFKKSDTEGFKYNVMNIKMPHKFHLQEVEAKCVDCHYNIKHDKFHPITNRPRMEVCFECHDEETTGCSKCHTRGSIEVLAALPLSDTVEQKICSECHEDFQTKQIPFYEVDFSHPSHLKQRILCGECHSNANLHGQIVKTRDECMQCHHQSTQRECTDCHKFENLFRNGTALAKIEGEPDAMAEMVSCDGCHAEIAEGHLREDVLGACSMCHEESGFENKVDEIQIATESSILEIEALLKQAKIVEEGLPESSRKETQTLIKHGEDLLKILKKDRSLGFHNAIYSALLVSDAKNSLEKVIFETGVQTPPSEN